MSIKLLLAVCIFFAFSDGVWAEESPPAVGNFALSESQQPGPLVSFGQTLIGRNHLQLSYATFSPFHIAGPFDNQNAALTFGLTDDASLYFNYPIAADNAIRTHASHGYSTGSRNVTIQVEQALNNFETTQYQEQVTIVGAVVAPTNVATQFKAPSGYEAPSYFFGGTYLRTYVDWMLFASPGLQVASTSHGVRLGSQAFYQAGIGRNVLAVPQKSTLFVLLEIDGQYTEKTQVFGIDNPNSGGNMISLTPSFALSTAQTITQFGVGFPVVQQLYGHQQKMDYFIMAQFTWTVV